MTFTHAVKSPLMTRLCALLGDDYISGAGIAMITKH